MKKEEKMDINGLAVLGFFIIVIVILAVWNSQTKLEDPIKADVSKDPRNWNRRI